MSRRGNTCHTWKFQLLCKMIYVLMYSELAKKLRTTLVVDFGQQKTIWALNGIRIIPNRMLKILLKIMSWASKSIRSKFMLTPHGDRFHFPGIYYLVEWRWGVDTFHKAWYNIHYHMRRI